MTKEEKQISPEYLEGYFDGVQSARKIFDKCTDDADKLNYDKGCKPVAKEAYEWLKKYAWVTENNCVNFPMLVHDFFKDFKKYM